MLIINYFFYDSVYIRSEFHLQHYQLFPGWRFHFGGPIALSIFSKCHFGGPLPLSIFVKCHVGLSAGYKEAIQRHTLLSVHRQSHRCAVAGHQQTEGSDMAIISRVICGLRSQQQGLHFMQLLSGCTPIIGT